MDHISGETCNEVWDCNIIDPIYKTATTRAVTDEDMSTVSTLRTSEARVVVSRCSRHRKLKLILFAASITEIA